MFWYSQTWYVLLTDLICDFLKNNTSICEVDDWIIVTASPTAVHLPEYWEQEVLFVVTSP